MKRLLASLFIAVALSASASELQTDTIPESVTSPDGDVTPWVKALLATIPPAAVLVVTGAGFSCGAHGEDVLKGKNI